ncbi:hypothetical protein [Burkholderia gladioli]|uniref:hypothetical protein n=1 Tax=Burkholderia gladioli TaxID=28095 RepID=UPI00164050F2|nr:hypothetical protein [Burkholderia gladioli]
MDSKMTKEVSKLTRFVADNVGGLIGDGRRFDSVASVAKLPHRDPLGQKAVYRALKSEQELGLGQLLRLSEAVGVSPQRLICADWQNPVELLAAPPIREELMTLFQRMISRDTITPYSDAELTTIRGMLDVLDGASKK